MADFTAHNLRSLWTPSGNSAGEDNGQVTIIGGSELFSGAPLLSLVATSRLVDMLFLATPEQDKGIVANVALYSKLRSCIWVPREDIEAYVEKSDAVLIGPGLMRFHKESSARPSGKAIYDEAGTQTKALTKYLLQKFPHKKWVIDGGSLQTMDAQWIPPGAVLTPNKHEFTLLFGDISAQQAAQDHACIIVDKAPVSIVTNGDITYELRGGNAGLTKGGTGDTLAGIIVGFLAKNDPLLAATAGTFLIKKTADYLETQMGLNFNADDVAENVFPVLRSLLRDD